MDSHVHEGRFVVEIGGRKHTVYYEISSYSDGWFNLCVFYNGKKQLDRVQAQSFDLHKDVTFSYGPKLFEVLLHNLAS